MYQRGLDVERVVLALNVNQFQDHTDFCYLSTYLIFFNMTDGYRYIAGQGEDS